MNFPVEIWIRILELALDAVDIERDQHDHLKDWDASCANTPTYGIKSGLLCGDLLTSAHQIAQPPKNWCLQESWCFGSVSQW